MTTPSDPSVDDPTDSASSQDEELIEDLDEVQEVIPFTYSITSYGADYPIDSLVKRMDVGDILVPTFNWNAPEQTEVVGFQRQYVWPRPKADRFIESLLLGLPVPGIFLVREPSGIFLVLDGHQRLYTLHAFYQGVIEGKEYRLSNVQQRYAGKRYKDLDVEDRRRLDDSIIHATVVRQDEPTDDQSSIYVIFERLNTGGVTLQPQEIRVALYHGEFVRVLSQLNEIKEWRTLYGKKSKRLKDIEMIVRFFAFFYYSEKYRSPMKDFLNRYMASNRHLERQNEQELTTIFAQTVQALLEGIGPKAFRPKRAINAAVVDSLMVAVAKRISEKGELTDLEAMSKAYDSLIDNDRYRTAIETGTSQESNVQARLEIADKYFAHIQ